MRGPRVSNTVQTNSSFNSSNQSLALIKTRFGFNPELQYCRPFRQNRAARPRHFPGVAPVRKAMAIPSNSKNETLALMRTRRWPELRRRCTQAAARLGGAEKKLRSTRPYAKKRRPRQNSARTGTKGVQGNYRDDAEVLGWSELSRRR